MNATSDDCRSWNLQGTPGVECFRATSLTRTYARHTHEGFAIGVFERGTGISQYRGATRRFPPGSIVAMNPDEPHTGSASNARGLTYRMFYITQQAWLTFVPLQAAPYFRDACIQDSALAGALVTAHKAAESASLLAGASHLADALATLSGRYGGERPIVGERREPAAIARAKQYLRAHLHRSISIEELAVHTGVSEAHLIRAFRRATGVPPHAWLLQQRVELAKTRLVRGDAIAGVAADLGFADQSHFTRRFRLVTGLTPRQFVDGQRRSIR